MIKKTLLGIPIPTETSTIILEQIKKYIVVHDKFCHIVSLNPENMVIAQKNQNFKKVIETAQIKIIDGVGIVLAAQILGIPVGQRYTGVDLMNELIVLAQKSSLTVLLIGGKSNLALSLAKCYQETYIKAKFIGTIGIKNINRPSKKEEQEILMIVRSCKPNLIFAAFGSPEQELWLSRHKKQFKGIVCMGVGQGFDIALGIVNRAPAWVQKIGFEWLYRLLTQPWRWKRQLRLIEFMWLVLRERISAF